MSNRLLTFIIVALWTLGALAGCAALQSGIDKTNDWLAKPATTQPNSPTNEQAVQTGTAVVTTVAPQPWGTAIGTGAVALLTLIHLLDSRRRTAKVLDAVETKAGDAPPAPDAPK